MNRGISPEKYLPGLKRSVAVAGVNRNLIFIDGRQIYVPITVGIESDDVYSERGSQQLDGGIKGSVPFAEQNLNKVLAICAQNQIEFAVTV